MARRSSARDDPKNVLAGQVRRLQRTGGWIPPEEKVVLAPSGLLFGAYTRAVLRTDRAGRTPICSSRIRAVPRPQQATPNSSRDSRDGPRIRYRLLRPWCKVGRPPGYSHTRRICFVDRIDCPHRGLRADHQVRPRVATLQNQPTSRFFQGGGAGVSCNTSAVSMTEPASPLSPPPPMR